MLFIEQTQPTTATPCEEELATAAAQRLAHHARELRLAVGLRQQQHALVEPP